MIEKARAEQILENAGVLLNGHFILTSGRHSNQYMQCAQILQYPWYAEEMVRSFVEDFKNDRIEAVIAPATGGIIIAYEAARQLKVKNLFAERENGKMSLRRGFQIEPGARVLVTEDVVTTGGTVKEVIELVQSCGGVVAGVALLVDRSMGAVEFGVKTCAAYTADVQSYDVQECPLCREGCIPPVKPGSRSLKP